jgi:magnesium chelatase family protein
MAANPCPCGRAVGKATDCTCTPQAQRLYAARLSGPIRDRIDLQIEVLPISRGQMTGVDAPPREDTATVAARVATARAVQAERWAADGWKTNGEVPGPALRRAWRLDPAATVDLDRALDRGLVTVRGYDRILRVGWTLADLEGASRPHRDHLGEALLMRHVGRVAA